MATFQDLAEKKQFIVDFITAINTRQPLDMSDVDAKIAIKTPVTSRRMEGETKSGETYHFWFTNLLDQPTWENNIIPLFGAFLQDDDAIDAFDTAEELRDHMNQEFVNKASVSINVFDDDNNVFDINEIGRGIEISGVPRTYEFDMDGNGTMVTRIGLSLSTIHRPERAKVGGKKLTESLLANLSL